MIQSGEFLTDISGITSGLNNLLIFKKNYSKEFKRINIDTKKYKNKIFI